MDFDSPDVAAVLRDRYYAHLVSRLLQEGWPATLVFDLADAWLTAIERWDAHIRRLPPPRDDY